MWGGGVVLPIGAQLPVGKRQSVVKLARSGARALLALQYDYFEITGKGYSLSLYFIFKQIVYLIFNIGMKVV